MKKSKELELARKLMARGINDGELMLLRSIIGDNELLNMGPWEFNKGLIYSKGSLKKLGLKNEIYDKRVR